MANPPSTSSNRASDVAARYNHLESQVAGVAGTLNLFIKESQEYRERNERDQSKMWEAIGEQGKQLASAVDRLSSKGQISWPMILGTVGMILSVSAAAAGVGQLLMESRIKQLEIREEFLQAFARENHESIRQHEIRERGAE